MAHSRPFSNLTNFYFLISPNEYARNLSDELYGCFKHVGMSWDMIMSMPIQERRAMIHRHNVEQDSINKRIEAETGGPTMSYDGEAINRFAQMEQSNRRGGA